MFSARLNERILELAPRFEVSDRAPGTFADLVASRTGGLLQVWPGASEGTIYGDPRVNWAFRAWHDALHLSLGAGFDLEGERRVAEEQARVLGCDGMGAIVLAEVLDQAEHFARTGAFPTDQAAFMAMALRRRGL
jgi:hypothetical protein